MSTIRPSNQVKRPPHGLALRNMRLPYSASTAGLGITLNKTGPMMPVIANIDGDCALFSGDPN